MPSWSPRYHQFGRVRRSRWRSAHGRSSSAARGPAGCKLRVRSPMEQQGLVGRRVYPRVTFEFLPFSGSYRASVFVTSMSIFATKAHFQSFSSSAVLSLCYSIFSLHETPLVRTQSSTHETHKNRNSSQMKHCEY